MDRGELISERIRMLEGLLAQSEDERRAELVYLATARFLQILSDMGSEDAGTGALTKSHPEILDPRSYRIRLRDREDVLLVHFLPKLERIRGGGWEIGVEKSTGEILIVTPLM
ncbi:MAG: hypothetical protein ABS41_05190 [Arenimonas sp. SCN 70-307]|nr:MAG: hypothetical protein ABS41_05190 [Arenimonas sp. SCN 70-307]